ncbi:MAG TPA: hypothetical protein VLG09_04840 [Candidatus Saccharimonadales bacterium]|nr:hypothetical protein [Candidatus Saccharimonadales bacterium]
MITGKILHTLETYDKDRTTITIGGAAIAMHLSKIGIEFTTEDVDVLCSARYFTSQTRHASSFEPDAVHTFQIRYPYGEPHTRALSPVLDIYPGTKTADTVLAFSASNALGGQWHPITYEDCLRKPEIIVKYANYSFLSMAAILIWTAKAGRQKDILKVDHLLPLSLEHSLITKAQYENIKTERDHSVELRRQYPNRHHARVAL